MDDLVRWLGEQLDEDERIARAAATEFGFAWTADGDVVSSEIDYVSVVEEPGSPTAFIAAHDPARVLREIDAKRRLIAEHDVYGRKLGERMDCQSLDFPCLTLRLLALPYEDRPGYQNAWRP